METVFHELPTPSNRFLFNLKQLIGLQLSILKPNRNLKLASLDPLSLRKLGKTRTDIIESDSSRYPETRQLADDIFNQYPALDGIIWPSKQHGDNALMLINDNTQSGDLILKKTEPLIIANAAMKKLYQLADKLGVILIDEQITLDGIKLNKS